MGVFLGVRITMGAKTTNWAAPRLTAQQISYAATDAWACRELYLKFKELGLV
jgi:ribonuclease D